MTPAQQEAAVRALDRKGSVGVIEPEGSGLRDLESGAFYDPPSIRHAIGWAMAGEWDSDGTNPAATRLANWWRSHR